MGGQSFKPSCLGKEGAPQAVGYVALTDDAGKVHRLSSAVGEPFGLMEEDAAIETYVARRFQQLT